MEIIKNYFNIAVYFVAFICMCIIYFYVNTLKNTIEDLENTQLRTNIELANEKLKSTRYKASLDAQNKEIEALKLQTFKASEKLKKYRSSPAKIKYKVIYRTREVKSNDCKDVQGVVDGVRAINFSSL